MTYDDEDITDEALEPGPEVTPELFHQWQMARRGQKPAEDMTNPVWLWLFRGRLDPYYADEQFKTRISKMRGCDNAPSGPGWAGCRMGQSRTQLSDGRVFWIAGEHEDFYDPDFYIYNDVTIEHPNGEVRIVGYPESAFRPTDFHSATTIFSERTILLIGSIGYLQQRDFGHTQIYALDTESLAIEKIEPTGNQPGWISYHRAKLGDDGMSIIIQGGKVMTPDDFLENIDDWSLSLRDYRWTRLTMRKWIRFQVVRTDGERLHLWQYSMRDFAVNHPQSGFVHEDTLADQIGAEPNMEAYRALRTPPLAHTPVDSDSEERDDWQTTTILIDGVRVRFVDDMVRLVVTIEGALPQITVDTLAEDLRSKLALVENADCQIKWID